MHCPKCGAEAPLTQKFGRVCGFSLENIPQLVMQQLSDDVTEKLQERKQKIEHWLTMSGTGFAALAALSLLTGLIYLMVAGNTALIPGIVILILLLSGIVAGSLAIYSESLKKSLSDRTALKSSTLWQTAILPPHETYPAPPISVTERTTTLLENNETVKKEN